MRLVGKRVAVLAEADYQDLEVWYPILRLREEGAEVLVVGSGASASFTGKYGYPIQVDQNADEVDAALLDGVVVPGGWAPDRLRQHESVLDIVRRLDAAGKLVASICHGGWVLASAGIVKGRTVTGYRAIRDDLVNAGAKYVDAECVRDKNLITARIPDDLPAFMRASIAFLEGSTGD